MAFDYPQVIPWLIFAAVVIAVLVGCFVFVLCFKDPKEWAVIPTFVTTFGLFIILFCCCIIPVDIFTVSQVENPESYALFIRITYYVSFLTLFVFAFVIIPFAYFFYEEDDEDSRFIWRCLGALKYTIFTVICMILIIALALILRFGDYNDEKAQDWVKKLVDAEHFGDRAIGFIVACLAIVGLLVWNIYTAYGMAALPIGLIKGKKRISQDMDEVTLQLDDATERIKNIREKYSLSGKSMTKRDKKDMQMYKAKARHLRHRKTQLEDTQQNSWMVKLEPFIYPFKLVTGLIFGLIVIAIMVSVILTSIDRIISSKCGISCGFILDGDSKIPNLIDLLLTYSSMVFPIDYIIFGIFISIILIAAVTGLANIGINFLCIRLYKIRFRSTVPQGLLTGCVFLMFVVVAFSFLMISFAPQYTAFGSQKYTNEKGQHVPCTYDAIAKHNNTKPTNVTMFDSDMSFGEVIGRPCYMSQLATLVNRIALRVPAFSILFYVENWVFIGCFIISFIISIFRPPASFAREAIYGDDSDEEEEEEISRSTRRRRPASRMYTRRPKMSLNDTSSYNTL